eukprot:GEMP01043228.1.p1 GENE.GEMP01043228.1~~GEMP01043228.1.p1  ORF type:complete len:470 (+),score=32.88 GEMP01043228.1:126-1535(+)
MLTYVSRVRLTFGVAWGVRSTELLQGLPFAGVATRGPSPRLGSKVHPKTLGIASVSHLSVSDPSYRELPLPTFLARGTEEDKERFALLNVHVKEARTPRGRSTYQKRTKLVKRIDLEGKLRCAKCGVFMPVESFYMDSASTYGRFSYCKVCASDWTRNDNGSTLRRIMNHIISSAKTSAMRRSRKPFREAAGEFDLSVGDLLDLWQKQEGRCAYSEAVMNRKRYTSWRLSLERRNNTLGYTRGNVVFVCSEFNTADQSIRANGSTKGSSQWSRHKVQSLPESIRCSAPDDNLELGAIVSKRNVDKDKKKLSQRQISTNGDFLCTVCNTFKPPEDYYIRLKCSFGRERRCKACRRTLANEYENTRVGFLKRLLHSAKASAARRAEKGRADAGEFRLKFDDLLQMYQQQRGLCLYSGVKMNLQPHTHWKCSIERFDNSKGYIPSNVALICSEFQTCDHSSRAYIPVKGSSQ